ncbi:MAG: STAS domain-containing protein [Bacteroidetes bacterium]|nr:STAS domain-containing protein [Bacteroidota bacterium]
MLFDYKLTEEQNCEIISLSGELIDKNQAADMIKAIDGLLESGKTRFVVELGDLKYMNSSGLNILIQLLTKTRAKGGETVICHVNKKVNELLLITKLNTLFKVVDTKEEALKKLQSQ